MKKYKVGLLTMSDGRPYLHESDRAGRGYCGNGSGKFKYSR